MTIERNFKAFVKEHLVLIVLLAVLQIILGIILARAYLLVHNTLTENGKWVSTKTTLEKGVMGAYAYIQGLQALAGNRLNLGAWHGYQELIYRHEADLEFLECDVLLEPQTYINVIFNKQETRYSGIRLSVDQRYPSLYFQARASGEFTKKVPLPALELQENNWHHAKLHFDEDGFSLFLDGKEQGTFIEDIPEKQFFGFRGSYLDSFVDNILIQPRHSQTIRESFDNRGNALSITVFAIMILGLVNALCASPLLLIKKKRKEILFTIVLINIVLIPLGTFVYGYQYVTEKYYPDVDETLEMQEKAFKQMTKAEMVRRIVNTYSQKPEEHTYRILVLGSSQTWGAGAAQKGDPFVEVLENLLNTHLQPAGMQVECINGGLSSGDSADILSLYKKEWIGLHPHMVIINLSNNDRKLDPFRKNMTELVAFSLEQGIQPVLVLEANSIEVGDRGLLIKHDVLRSLGNVRQIPVIDMHSHLLQFYDHGFLWWDVVHLTSFGQQLAAFKLYEELVPKIPHAVLPQNNR